MNKLSQLRLQFDADDGPVRQATFGDEATTNHEAHPTTMRPKQDERQSTELPPVDDGEDEEMSGNIEAPALDIRNLSPQDCQFVVEHINHYNKFGFNKDDIESEKDHRFQIGTKGAKQQQNSKYQR